MMDSACKTEELFMCRVCESPDLLINIFINETHQIVEKICFCASVQISESDGLPQHICSRCFSDLEVAYAFRKRCEQKDYEFRHFAELKTEDFPTEADYLEEESENNDNKEEIGNIDYTEVLENDDYEEERYVHEPIQNEQQSTPEAEPNVELLEPDETSFDSKDCDDTSENESSKSYQCETCGEVFSVRHEYHIHIRVHGNKRFQCKTCFKWFSRRNKCAAHELSHLGIQKRYPCEQCPLDFNCRPALVRHITGVHEKRRDFICKLCGKSFAQKSGLQTHQSVHNGKTYKCSKCPSTYKDKRFWLRHEQLHLPFEERDPTLIFQTPPQIKKPRKYVCSYCGKISNNQMTHVVHERYHLDERPYPCQICDKRFRSSSQRNKHMRIHTGVKPFKCETCGSCFREKSHLTTHNLTHTQKREHVCLICSKAFALKATLRSHMKCHSVFAENKP
ncbi:zinc finger protein OZF-like [Toxorhynchites rutilus septentrionalis]|uniref:zinc finger protein OZF-like n=1 Tax=Toxorhynchites rutilus septentrionalis TaxID=329112 RepID=UPI00247AFBE8|nr:zinc finger protein OZF-like [Toxorhynchites rutilus septentrionalis]